MNGDILLLQLYALMAWTQKPLRKFAHASALQPTQWYPRCRSSKQSPLYELHGMQRRENSALTCSILRFAFVCLHISENIIKYYYNMCLYIKYVLYYS